MLSHVKPLSREQAQRFPLLFSGIETGFGQILEGCRFAEWVRTVLAWKHEGISDEENWRRIYQSRWMQAAIA